MSCPFSKQAAGEDSPAAAGCPFSSGARRAALLAQHTAPASGSAELASTAQSGMEVLPRAPEDDYAYASRAHLFLEECHEKFGDTFVMNRFGHDHLFVRGAKEVREVILSGQFEKTWNNTEENSGPTADYVMNLVQPLLARTVFNMNADENAPRRKALRPVVLYAEQYNNYIASQLDEDVASLRDGEFDSLDWCHMAVRKNILVACCGEAAPIVAYKHLPTYSEVLDYFVARFGADPEIHPTVTQDDIEMLHKLEKVGDATVAEFIELGYDKKHEMNSVIAAMLDSGYSPKEAGATVINLMIAGAEAPSSLLAFALEELAHNSEVQDKLAAEILSVCGRDGKVEDHLNEMPYLEGCVRESMRLFAPATLVQRVAQQDVVVAGVRVPKDTVVQLCITAIHKDPKQFPDPQVFRPERDTNKYEILGKDSCLMTFSSGPRGCPGRHIAANILRLFMGKLIQKFLIMPSGPRSSEPDMLHKFIGWQEHGIPLIAARR